MPTRIRKRERGPPFPCLSKPRTFPKPMSRDEMQRMRDEVLNRISPRPPTIYFGGDPDS